METRGLLGAWERFWFGEGSLVRLAVFRVLILMAALYGVWVFRIGVFQHAEGATGLVDRHWRPIFAFEQLHIGPPNAATARAIFAVLLTSIGLGIVGLFTRTACAITALLTFYWVGAHYSFGKPHHDFIALIFALMALPFGPIGARLSIDAWLRRRRGTEVASSPARWAKLPIRVAQVTAALGYTFAGGSKLFIGGIEWLNGYSLQAAMLHFHAPWTEFFTASPRLCQLMSIHIVAVQATFLLAFVPVLRWFYVPMAVVFHLMSWMTMATGPYLTLWWVVVAAFVPWDRVPAWLSSGFASIRLLKWMALLGLAGWALWIWFLQVPGVLAPVVLAAVALALYSRQRRTVASV